MENVCKHCGISLDAKDHWGNLMCDGVLTLGADPYAEEIHGDFSESWDCMGGRHESAMDI